MLETDGKGGRNTTNSYLYEQAIRSKMHFNNDLRHRLLCHLPVEIRGSRVFKRFSSSLDDAPVERKRLIV